MNHLTPVGRVILFSTGVGMISATVATCVDIALDRWLKPYRKSWERGPKRGVLSGASSAIVFGTTAFLLTVVEPTMQLSIIKRISLGNGVIISFVLPISSRIFERIFKYISKNANRSNEIALLSALGAKISVLSTVYLAKTARRV